MGNLKDFATAIIQVAPSPGTSGTELQVDSGLGSWFPPVPFYATAHPDGQLPTLDNAEKVLVTNVDGDTFTIVRAQGGTQAKDISVGWRLSNAIYADDIEGRMRRPGRSLSFATPVFTEPCESTFGNFYGTGTISYDTNIRLFGSASLKIQTPSDTSNCGADKDIGEQDWSDKVISFWVRSDDWANITSLLLLITDNDSWVNFWDLNVFNKVVSITPYNNEWIEVVASMSDFFQDGPIDISKVRYILFRATSSNGTTPTVWIDQLTVYPAASRGVVSIVFDDIFESALEGKKKMDQYGYLGSMFVMPEVIGTGSFMTQEQIDYLHDSGWDIGGHGNTNLTTLDSDQLDRALKFMRKYLDDHGYRGGDIIAYPGGGVNYEVEKAAQKYFQYGRTIYGLQQPLLHMNPMRLNCAMVINNTSTETIQNLIDDAVDNGHWLILLFHELVETAPTTFQYTTANFATIIDYLHTKGADVLPMSAVLQGAHPGYRTPAS